MHKFYVNVNDMARYEKATMYYYGHWPGMRKLLIKSGI